MDRLTQLWADSDRQMAELLQKLDARELIEIEAEIKRRESQAEVVRCLDEAFDKVFTEIK